LNELEDLKTNQLAPLFFRDWRKKLRQVAKADAAGRLQKGSKRGVKQKNSLTLNS